MLLLPLHDLIPGFLIHPVMNVDHGLDSSFRGLPALPAQSVVELLWRRVFPLDVVVGLGSWDRGDDSLCRKGYLLVRERRLGQVGDVVVWVQLVATFTLVHRAAWWRFGLGSLSLMHGAAWWWAGSGSVLSWRHADPDLMRLWCTFSEG